VKLILLIFLFIIIRFTILKAISKVHFYEDFVEVVYFSNRRKHHYYHEINVFREHQQGFYPIIIIITHLRDKKKFYFSCPNSKRPELDRILETKGKVIRSQL
jgi:hypothetical protein